jgi:hypothetical protein
MQNISSAKELRYAIESLEADRIVKEQVLKEQVCLACENLRPVNIIKRSLKDFNTSKYLGNNISGAIMGLVSGYLSGTIFTGRSANIFRKLLGSMLQFGVTTVVANKSDSIKSAGMAIFENFLHKKVLNPKRNAR